MAEETKEVEEQKDSMLGVEQIETMRRRSAQSKKYLSRRGKKCIRGNLMRTVFCETFFSKMIDTSIT